MALDDSRMVGQRGFLWFFDDFPRDFGFGLWLLDDVRLFWTMLSIEYNFLAILPAVLH